MKVQRVPFLRVQTCSFGKDCICKGLVALVHRPKESFFLIPQLLWKVNKLIDLFRLGRRNRNLLNASNLLPDAAKMECPVLACH
ncbi:uncharacterized protein LOC112189379 isoform X2 [Rosa chinensis]|uniref:uncharacterized protein LOC112189379 isoform X2 n=1 Tax=Rosa chinensis TaxID=74649 RepID=UPI000D0970C8|nr:uncharacterized protein LOC112189379 isoform X2 [Rosa chinensis]